MVENPGHPKALDVLGLSSLIHLCNNTWTSAVVPLDWQTGGGGSPLSEGVTEGIFQLMDCTPQSP